LREFLRFQKRSLIVEFLEIWSCLKTGIEFLMSESRKCVYLFFSPYDLSICRWIKYVRRYVMLVDFLKWNFFSYFCIVYVCIFYYSMLIIFLGSTRIIRFDSCSLVEYKTLRSGRVDGRRIWNRGSLWVGMG